MISRLIIVIALLETSLGEHLTKATQTLEKKNETLQEKIDRVRRSVVRATLAEKLDPNFWPTRGRRSHLKEKDIPSRLQLIKIPNGLASLLHDKQSDYEEEDGNRHLRQNSAENGPFWANRGRSLNNDDEEVFWAGRGRSIDDVAPLFDVENSLQKEPNNLLYRYVVDNTHSVRALTSAEEPFWANRGRSTDEEPFWANRGRALNSGEEGPFWANRGKREREQNDDPQRAGRWRRQPLYVEEPRWILLARRQSPYNNIPRESDNWIESGEEPYNINPRDDPFWVARGKKRKRESPTDIHTFLRTSIGKKNTQNVVRALNKINEDHFWPVRGKRVNDDKESTLYATDSENH